MNVEQLMGSITPQVYERLKQATETGKWLDGSTLTDEQRESCLQVVMLYQAKVDKTNQHMTISDKGEIVHKSKSELRHELRGSSDVDSNIATFNKDDF